jgi:hypothetical protein
MPCERDEHHGERVHQRQRGHSCHTVCI